MKLLVRHSDGCNSESGWIYGWSLLEDSSIPAGCYTIQLCDRCLDKFKIEAIERKLAEASGELPS